MTSDSIKILVAEKGADICGIASVSRFKEAPAGFHPKDLFPDCRSVIVYGVKFPASPLRCNSNSPYTFIRNKMVEKIDDISFGLTCDLEVEEIAAIPIPSADPYDFWNTKQKHGRGILSLKHAAVLAGLGVMGKNTLLITRKFGNMIWLGAVLTDVELVPDSMVDDSVCGQCNACIDACPQKALNGITIDQKKCREKSISVTQGGGWVLSCNICRKVCPTNKGRRQKSVARIQNEKQVL